MKARRAARMAARRRWWEELESHPGRRIRRRDRGEGGVTKELCTHGTRRQTTGKHGGEAPFSTAKATRRGMTARAHLRARSATRHSVPGAQTTGSATRRRSQAPPMQLLLRQF